MLIVTMIGIIALSYEVLRTLMPVVALRQISKIKLLVTHSDGHESKLKIDMKRGCNRTYRISPDTDAYLTREKIWIYIHTPHKQKLYSLRRYRLENGMSVRVKHVKPKFMLTALYVAVIFIFTMVGKPFIKERTATDFVSSTIPVTLTHENIGSIDMSRYQGVKNYLVVGTDQRNGQTTAHADVILLLSCNEKTNKIKICSILRDVYALMRDKAALTIDDLDPSLPNYQILSKNVSESQWIRAKLNFAVNLQYIDGGEHKAEEYFAEGLNSLVNTVEYMFKIPIDGVVCFTWSEFIELIDRFGGVEMEITEDMLVSGIEGDHAIGINAVLDDQNALYGYKDHIDHAGVQLLNGNMALAYARLRYIYGSTNSDVDRQKEQVAKLAGAFISQKRAEILKYVTPEKIAELTHGLYSSLSKEQTEELIDMVLSIPSVDLMGTLPYDFHNITIDGVQYIGVDGKNEPSMELQAMELMGIE